MGDTRVKQAKQKKKSKKRCGLRRHAQRFPLWGKAQSAAGRTGQCPLGDPSRLDPGETKAKKEHEGVGGGRVM